MKEYLENTRLAPHRAEAKDVKPSRPIQHQTTAKIDSPPVHNDLASSTSGGSCSARETLSSIGLDQSGTIKLGRYWILFKVGSGGMGEVFAAWDPELDREVAIKITQGKQIPVQQRSLLEEARAMACLTDPYVVPVYDVGITDSLLWMAMELVAGDPLSSWLAAEPRPWSAVLDKFVDAARGLAAVHAVGLVHRDFKPSNVVLTEGGRARLLDFGLAVQTVAHHRQSTTGDAPCRSKGDCGGIAGTPPYIAPEQQAGLPPTPQSDQFSFCVALFEALYGRRPFPTAAKERMMAIATCRLSAPCNARHVPPWILPIIKRGLAADPNRRWPNMDALVQALEAHPTRIGPLFRISALLGSLVLGAMTIGQLQENRRGCHDDESTAPLLDEKRIAKVGATLEDGDATAAWGRASSHLQTWVSEWQGAYAAACEAGVPNDCLTNLRRRFRGLLQVLEDSDINAGVLAAVYSLPRSAVCNNPTNFTAELPPPSATIAADVQRSRATLARADALRNSGRTQDAYIEALAAGTQSAHIEYPPLEAEIALSTALASSYLGRPKVAEKELKQAYRLGRSSSHDSVAARAAIELIYVLGFEQTELSEAHLWLRHAESAVRRAGPDIELSARLDIAIGMLCRKEWNFDAARSAFTRAYVSSVGRYDGIALSASGALLDVDVRTGDLDSAYQGAFEYLSMAERRFGARDRTVGAGFNTLGIIYLDMGDLSSAKSYLEWAESIYLDEYGPDSLNVIRVRSNISHIDLDAGRIQEGMRRMEGVRATALHTLGSAHPVLASIESFFGMAKTALGDHQTAAIHHERARMILEAVYRLDHPKVGRAYELAARAYIKDLRPALAVPLARRALAIYDQNHFARKTIADAELTLAEALAASPTSRLEAQRLLDTAYTIGTPERVAAVEEALGGKNLSRYDPR